jgi:hypothetical protein
MALDELGQVADVLLASMADVTAACKDQCAQLNSRETCLERMS